MDDPDLISRKRIQEILGLGPTRTNWLMKYDRRFPEAVHTVLGDLYSERQVIEYAAQRPLRRGRPRPPDEFYQRVAEVYRSLPRRRGRTQSVAEALGGSHRQAERWVAEARTRGLLPPSGRRKKKMESPGA